MLVNFRSEKMISANNFYLVLVSFAKNAEFALQRILAFLDLV